MMISMGMKSNYCFCRAFLSGSTRRSVSSSSAGGGRGGKQSATAGWRRAGRPSSPLNDRKVAPIRKFPAKTATANMRHSRPLKSSSSSNTAEPAKPKYAQNPQRPTNAWTRGVPMADKEIKLVTVKTDFLVNDTSNYESIRGALPGMDGNTTETQFSPTFYSMNSSQAVSEVNATTRDAVFKFPKHKRNFDFEVPALTPTSGPNGYPENEFNDFHEVVTQIMSKGQLRGTKKGKATAEDVKAVADFLYRNEPLLEINLPSLRSKYIHDDEDKAKEMRTKFMDELSSQREAFLKAFPINDFQYQVLINVLVLMGNYCSKFSRHDALKIAWQKLKEAGVCVTDKTCSSYLYVFTSPSRFFGESPSASPSIMSDIFKDMRNEEDDTAAPKEDIPCEVATYNDLLYKPTEKSISLRVKSLVATGDPASAEALLDTLSTGKDGEDGGLKLRTYLPVLKSYCDQHLCDAALSLFTRMRNSPQTYLEPENYVLIISTLASNGYFRNDSKHLINAKSMGYSSDRGFQLFNEMVTQMAADVLEISSTSARRLHNAFVSSSSDLMLTGAKELPSLASMPPCDRKAEDKELIVSRTLLNSTSARCPVSDASLRLIKLDKEQRKRLHDELIELSIDQYMEFNKRRNATEEGSQIAAVELNKFAEWLNTREGKPFTAVIDGANAAYLGQNFHQGKFNYYQIEFLVRALESINEHPVVVLPAKYTEKNFNINIAGWKQQALEEKEEAVIKWLHERGQIYIVPPGCLDDYYWMLASISDQERSTGGKSLDVDSKQAQKEGRFPGTRPMLLSNDLMRDHRLELFEPRLFRRWTASYIVNYNFTAFVDDECIDPEIGFSTPEFFSREIQCNPSGNDAAWHFPVSDWETHERLLIRLPSTK